MLRTLQVKSDSANSCQFRNHHYRPTATDTHGFFVLRACGKPVARYRPIVLSAAICYIYINEELLTNVVPASDSVAN